MTLGDGRRWRSVLLDHRRKRGNRFSGGAVAGGTGRFGGPARPPSPEPLEFLAAELGPQALACPGDACSSDDLDRAVRSALERFGRIDGLAHCVGSIVLKSIHLCATEEFLATIQINLITAFLACRAVSTALRKAKSGSVVLASSVAVRQGLNNHDVIAAAKGGLEAMVRSAAITYARSNIRFNAVAPE